MSMRFTNLTDIGRTNKPDANGNIIATCLPGATIEGCVREAIYALHMRALVDDSHGPAVARVVGTRYTNWLTFTLEGVTVSIHRGAEAPMSTQIYTAWRKARHAGGTTNKPYWRVRRAR